LNHRNGLKNTKKVKKYFSLKDGASPAFHESVGDAIIYAIQNPEYQRLLKLKNLKKLKHLNRKGFLKAFF